MEDDDDDDDDVSFDIAFSSASAAWYWNKRIHSNSCCSNMGRGERKSIG